MALSAVDLARSPILDSTARKKSRISVIELLPKGDDGCQLRETSSDPRPNKDLYELRPVLHHDMTETLEKWNNIVRHGVIPRWTRAKPQYQDTIPANHRSINGHEHSIRYHLHKGQLERRYLIMEANLLDQWPEIFVSPLAVVDKPGAAQQDIRLINDYSFPPDGS
ncbi:hypothetical protein F441_18348, partial [Phytophthora nicotianae CJ01A1]